MDSRTIQKAVKGPPDARSFLEYANGLRNISILTVKSVLFVALCYKHSNHKHEIQALIVDVDPSTIIRYVILAEELLMDILSTAKNVATAIRENVQSNRLKNLWQAWQIQNSNIM